MSRYRIMLAAAVVTAACLFYPDHAAMAQGKGHRDRDDQGEEHEHGRDHGKEKVVTADQAIFATRQVLVSHGYEIVRVETFRTTRVVYYRRGNMGRGKGKGPIEQIVIRPEPDRVVFVSPPPRGLMVDINVRLGM